MKEECYQFRYFVIYLEWESARPKGLGFPPYLEKVLHMSVFVGICLIDKCPYLESLAQLIPKVSVWKF